MKRLLLPFTLWVTGVGMAQTVPPVSAAGQLHGRALSAVQAERVRAKQPLCRKAMNTMVLNECYGRELGISDGNYGKLVRALGALIRSAEDIAGAPARIPFDDAEAAWNTYRDVACKAEASQFVGGTIQPSMEMDCRITLVRGHMEELWKQYADILTR